MNSTFSERHGHAPDVPQITIRNDAPKGLRHFVIEYAFFPRMNAKRLRAIICKTLKEIPDSNNWSDGNVQNECEELVTNCEWYRVYDVMEAIINDLHGEYGPTQEYDEYINNLNEYMLEKGIGWKIKGCKIIARAPEAIERTVTHTLKQLRGASKTTASSELHKAYADLSKRPEPDITGAVQHALASLECVAKDISGKAHMTLGKIVDTHPELFPGALGKVVGGIWGYASQNGRHLTEGREPEMKDAFLMVGLAASLSTYLIQKEEND